MLKLGLKPHLLSARSLVGQHVKNLDGEDLGAIEEVMVDLEFGRIAYVVLSFGGFLGLGDKLFAIPWSALQLSAEEEALILDVDKRQLEKAQGFDKDDWPEFADRSWGAELYARYGHEPYW